MGLYAITGIPGTGKTLLGLEWIVKALRDGRRVYTNIEGLDPNRLAGVFELDPIKVNLLLTVWDSSDASFIRQFQNHIENNSLVVLDEVQNYFGSRDWDTKEAKDLIPWITKHRHLGVDILFLTQTLDSVDITFRRLVALTYALKRLENLGLKSRTMIYIFDRANIDRAPLGRQLFKIDPKYFIVYKSYDADNVKETRKSANPILRSPMLWFLILLSCVGMYQMFSGGGIAKKIAGANHSQNAPETTPTPSPAGAGSGVASSASDSTKCWVGYKHINGVTQYMLKSGYFAYEKVPKCQ